MSKTRQLWKTTRFSNLIRYAPSGTYFIRAKVHGKLIRESLQTDVETVAKLKLDDRLKELRGIRSDKQASKLTFGDVAESFKAKLPFQLTSKGRPLKPLSQEYRKATLEMIYRSWPGLKTTEVKRISRKDCEEWSIRFRNKFSASRYNGALETLRMVLKLAIEEGALAVNPATGEKIKRAAVRQKRLTLPSSEQFQRILFTMDERDAYSPGAANLVRLLAYTGMRKSEARNFHWEHVDFERNKIVVHGDPEHGTKNFEARDVPMIPDLAELLKRLKPENATGRVTTVNECRYSLKKACELTGSPDITHHDLRHLFATRCIEAGVDIPTVSRWLGHKDGGALAMKTYGHLRDEHSTAMAQKVSFSAPKVDKPAKKKNSAKKSKSRNDSAPADRPGATVGA